MREGRGGEAREGKGAQTQGRRRGLAILQSEAASLSGILKVEGGGGGGRMGVQRRGGRGIRQQRKSKKGRFFSSSTSFSSKSD